MLNSISKYNHIVGVINKAPIAMIRVAKFFFFIILSESVLAQDEAYFARLIWTDNFNCQSLTSGEVELLRYASTRNEAAELACSHMSEVCDGQITYFSDGQLIPYINVQGAAFHSLENSSIPDFCKIIAQAPPGVIVSDPEADYDFGSGPIAMTCAEPLEIEPSSGVCIAIDDPDENQGCTGEYGVGNPCNVATGNKYQSETDFSDKPLSFIRTYNSLNLVDLGFGKGWRHNYQRKLIIATDALTQVTGTGRGEPWTKVNSIWQGDADSEVLISETTNGFVLTKKAGSTETYDFSGQLLSETDTNGHQTLYSYNTDNQLENITNHYGQSISFAYVNNKVDTVTDTQGAVYLYEYDTNDTLVSVIYSDATPSDDADNPRKIYHYENVYFPNHLAGTTDENGDRYATYAYDADGKAISTEHAQTTNAGGQEQYELDR